MEKAILKTLIYANLFEYPLKGYEVYKWLVGRQTTLLKVEKVLNKLLKEKKVSQFKGFFVLRGKEKLVAKRLKKEKYAKLLLRKAFIFAHVLKIVPWIKLVGISGGLALKDASKNDDIDFIMVTQEGRLWLSRLCAIFILNIFGVRRKVGMKEKTAQGKVCLNTILDENFFEQKNKDLYTAHEVLQMFVMWQRKGIYSKYLFDNGWVFKYLPNWTSKHKYIKPKVKKGSEVFDYLENLARVYQLKIMQKPQGLERIEKGGLYFYPHDYRNKILKDYTEKIKGLISTTVILK